MLCWDVGYQQKFKPLRRYYWGDCDAVIFMADLVDRERLNLARDELFGALAECEEALDFPWGVTPPQEGSGHAMPEAKKTPALLVLGNKMDGPNAMSVEELACGLGLYNQGLREGMANHPGWEWNIMTCSAVTGEGVYEAFDWLAHTVTSNPTRYGTANAT